MIIEGFNYINKANSIGNINLDVLQELLKRSINEEYNNLVIKKILNDSSSDIEDRGIFIYNTQNGGERHLIGCVNKYYYTEGNTCYNITDELNSISEKANLVYNLNCNCRECHLKAIMLYKHNLLKKKIGGNGNE